MVEAELVEEMVGDIVTAEDIAEADTVGDIAVEVAAAAEAMEEEVVAAEVEVGVETKCY